MFTVHCPRHGHEVLLGHRQLVGIDGEGESLTVRWVCWCGHRGTSHPQAPARPAAASVAA